MSAGWWFCTAGADSVHFQSMAAHAETMIGGNSFQHGRDFFVAEFHQLIAFFADEVIVLGIAVVMFIDFPVI